MSLFTVSRRVEGILLIGIEIENITWPHGDSNNPALMVEKYFTSEHRKQLKFFQTEKRNFVSPSGHLMLWTKFY